MTLMELLVALVIGSLILALVVRGLGLSLNLYERVVRITSSLDVEYREASWWVDSVASLAPCTAPEHCVRGGERQFQGFTLAGIVHPGGMRMPVQWQLVDNRNGRELQVIEGTVAGEPKPLKMATQLPSDSRFAYRHPDGNWLNEWNEDGDNLRLPVAIRIETLNGTVLAFATPAQRPYGRMDYRDVLGL